MEKLHHNNLNIKDLRKYNLDALVCIYKILKEVKQEPNCFIYDNIFLNIRCVIDFIIYINIKM